MFYYKKYFQVRFIQNIKKNEENLEIDFYAKFIIYEFSLKLKFSKLMNFLTRKYVDFCDCIFISYYFIKFYNEYKINRL